jgi:FlaA1/EpsC-like NDP-sugar epimerase
MRQQKIRLGFSIVTDILLINLAFLCAYQTCKLLGLNLLELFNLSENDSSPSIWASQSPSRIFLIIAFTVTAIRLCTYFTFQLYKPVWRYASVREFWAIVGAVCSGTFALILILSFVNLSKSWAFFLIDGLYNITFVGLAKFSFRIVEEYRRRDVAPPKTRVLIVGAGAAGVGVLREIRNHPEKGYVPIGFIDDHPQKVGKSIQGLDVLGTTRELAYIARKRQVGEIVIAMPSASGSRIREIIQQCEYKGCKFKIVPSIHAILAGHVSISQIREVRVEDLLNRPTSRIDLPEVSKYLSGKRVMVTGAGGSIGSELCRQVAKFNPELLILFGRGENSIYHIDNELSENEPDLNRAMIIGDIRDRSKVDKIIAKYRPQIIFHAAAHKHVKFMEIHPDEAVKNNIIGTKNVLMPQLNTMSKHLSWFHQTRRSIQQASWAPRSV